MTILTSLLGTKSLGFLLFLMQEAAEGEKNATAEAFTMS